MSKRTQALMRNTPIKASQVAQKGLADDARATRPGMHWVLELERARLLTGSYKLTEGKPMILRRAMGLAHILENMTIFIRPEELIVGNFACLLDAVVHYPEYVYKWIEKETAKGNVYEDMLTDGGREELREINKYWKNSAVHNLLRGYLPKELSDITYVLNYDVGTPNYDKLLNLGLKGFIKEAKQRKERLEKEFVSEKIDATTYLKKREFLDAVVIVLTAAITWAKRYSRLARILARFEKDSLKKQELELIAENCDHVPENPARTLHEAIQSYWLIHLIVNVIELPTMGDGIRFDVSMGQFYEKDLEKGLVTREMAQELVECTFIKSLETGYLQPSIWSGLGPGGLGFQTLSIGGVDSDGNDVTNEISLIILDAMKSIRTVTPPLALRWHDKIPKRLIDKTIECLASGMPQPGIFNDGVNIARLASFGIPIADARNYSIDSCMIPTIPGKNLARRGSWANWLPVPLCLTAALGLDVLPGYWRKPLGKAIAEPENISSMQELLDATMENCKYIMHSLVAISNIADALFKDYVPRPFLSAMLDDSIEKACDLREWSWGPGYREITVCGLNNVADSLAAIQKLVFDEKKVTMSDMIKALKSNWEGYDGLQQMCLAAPKFGNDDDYVDLISLELGKRIAEEAEKCKTYLGQKLYVDGTVATSFWLHGATCMATPDGRMAGESFHDGSISPMNSKDRKGPTAVLKSVSKIDPLQTWNHLFNQSFMPKYLAGKNKDIFAKYLKTSSDLGIHHIQFSIVGKKELEKAQQKPEDHSTLLVRVCGYSSYFVDLNQGMQNQIIERTSQQF